MPASFGFRETQLRRNASRQFTTWHWRFFWQDEHPRHRTDRQIIDVSAMGADLLLVGANAVPVRDRRLAQSGLRR